MNKVNFGIGDTVKHIYTNETLVISWLGTGNGKVSIKCVLATKAQWKLVKKYSEKGGK